MITLTSNSHKAAAVVAIFTSLQFLVLLLFGYTPYNDSESYIYIARECISYGEPYPVKALLNDIPFLWNIGAINAVAASLALTGSVVPLLIIYSLLKGLTALLFYLLSRRLFGPKTALLCLLLYVLYPANYGESTSTLSELPFMFFVMLGMWLSIVRSRYLLGGVMIAVANWFRPMGIVFVVSVVIFIVYQWKKGDKPLSAASLFRKGGGFLFGYILMICLIGFCSMQRTGLFLYQSKTGWMNLSDYYTDNKRESLAVRDNENWNVSQKDSAWCSMFIHWLGEHPGEYVSDIPRKIALTYVSDNVNMCVYTSDKTYDSLSLPTLIRQFPSYSAAQWIAVLNLVFYYLLLLTAAASLRRFSMKSHVLPLTCILVGTLVLIIIGYHGEARFHQPFMPFFIMLSALYLAGKSFPEILCCKHKSS